jgi:hypothetical protein
MGEARRGWNEWLVRLAVKRGGFQKLAADLSIHPTTLFRWLGAAVPEAFREGKLAEVAGAEVTEVRDLLNALRRERSAERAERRLYRVRLANGLTIQGNSRKPLAHAAPAKAAFHRPRRLLRAAAPA